MRRMKAGSVVAGAALSLLTVAAVTLSSGGGTDRARTEITVPAPERASTTPSAQEIQNVIATITAQVSAAAATTPSTTPLTAEEVQAQVREQLRQIGISY